MNAPARYGPRPSLPRLVVGSAAVVTVAFPSPRTYRAQVVKVARVWITLEAIDEPNRTWMLRRDTQDDGTGFNHRVKFATPEQHEWDTTLAAADARLRAHDVSTGYSGRWSSPQQRMLLADLLDQHAPVEDRP